MGDGVAEEGSDSPAMKHRGPVEDLKSTAQLESYSQTSMTDVEVLTNGIGRGDAPHSESGPVPNDGGGKLSEMDALEKREKLFSRQDSDRGGGGGGGVGGGGNKDKGVAIEGQSGDMKQEAGDMQVSYCFTLCVW